MKVTQEKLPASQMSVEIEIPSEMSTKTYDKVIQDLSRTVNIPGFRKGKVPRSILIQRIGQIRVKATALEELIKKCLDEAVKQESIQAITTFELISSFDELVNQFEPGKPLTFSAVVDVVPDVKLGDYSSLSIKAEEVEYDPSLVDKFLEERRTEKSTLIPVEGRPAQMGDVAVVDYIGRFIDAPEGETPAEIPGTEGKDYEIELGEGRFIEDIVQGIVGMTPGETKEVPVKFAEDFGRADLAGQSTTFTITLKELKEKELPPLDDDLAKQVSEFETLDELKAELESNFKLEAEAKTSSNKGQALVAEVVKNVEVELPESMISQEVNTIVRQTIMQMGQMGIDVNKVLTEDMVKHLQAGARPDAIARLKQSLALLEIAKRESVEVKPEEIEEQAKAIREQMKGREINEERLQEVVRTDLLQEKAIKWLEERATIELVPQGSLQAPQEEDSQTTTENTETEAKTTTIEATVVSSQTEQSDSDPNQGQ